LKRDQLLKVFYFFIFDLEYLIRVHSSEPIHGKMNSTSCLFGSRFACAQTQSFPPNHAPKIQERHQLFFGLQLVSKEFEHPPSQTKIEQHFGGSNKSAPANRKTEFFANHDLNKQEVGFIFA
jgi:hypothetical protein